MRQLLIGLRLAVGTLSIVPVGTLPEVDRTSARWAMVLAPVGALPVAVLAGLLAWVGPMVHLPALVVGIVVCAALGWGTRAMHWDGLADTADGLAAGWSRERALEVMRKGDTGPVAVGVLVVVLLLDAAAIAAVAPDSWGWLLVGVAVLASRAACTLVAVRGLPPARSDGLGVVVADNVPGPALAVTVLVTLAIAAAAGLVAGHVVLAPVAVALGFVAVSVLAIRCRTVLGGVTGDVMGAGVEIALAVSLLVLSTRGGA
ncbi:adenosylcobinamide-GDP ribazoletransferase [Allobranchiibius sp. GilTou73]|uniref:adenosylcobinamide-GDP ribazoletransferase n=1 Tax=unclassified Allobranchiibius TaxID=2649857 RepID=UPI001F368B47|nr:adenosylcobinamide-GDP ribazoletransferase [Allobranchiibius sp. GilTou73]UIJ35202.1 adenosylcobinamide-GDP ribazoletransferase [Allobranchiibius sp. GilTou73]